MFDENSQNFSNYVISFHFRDGSSVRRRRGRSGVNALLHSLCESTRVAYLLSLVFISGPRFANRGFADGNFISILSDQIFPASVQQSRERALK